MDKAMDKITDKEIEAYRKERDEVLLTGDVDKMIAFIAKHFPGRSPEDRELVEVGMHKSITAVKSLPLEHRLKSKAWLTQRGLHSFDDGELG